MPQGWAFTEGGATNIAAATVQAEKQLPASSERWIYSDASTLARHAENDRETLAGKP